MEEINQQKHYALLREVDKIRLIVRIGPSLGLMGTLITMGGTRVLNWGQPTS